MKIDQKGFGAVEALLLLVIFGIIGFVGWYVWQSKANTNKALQETAQGQGTITKTIKKSVLTPNDETSDWTPYSSKLGKFSLRYPKTWVQPTHKELCSKDIFDRYLYIGPDSNSVLRCATEYFGQISIGSMTGDIMPNLDNTAGSTKTKVTVDGVTGTRTYQVIDKEPEGIGDYEKGTIAVSYFFNKNRTEYSATYIQAPKGSAPSTDVLKYFDLIITMTLKFSS